VLLSWLETMGIMQTLYGRNEEGRLVTACETQIHDGMDIITEIPG